jgi:FKBP-type peptidyl-prolyl cis-trans isomerase
MRFLTLLSLMVLLPIGCSPPDSKPVAPAREGPIVVDGLQKVDLQLGNGATASEGKRAEVRYTLSTARGQVLKAVKPGDAPQKLHIQDGTGYDLEHFVAGMKEGGRRRITVPWGASYSNEHESHEPLIYEVTLVRVK